MRGAAITRHILLVPLLFGIPAVWAGDSWNTLLGEEIGSVEHEDASVVDEGTGLDFVMPGRGVGVSPATVKRQLSAVRTAPSSQLRGAKEAQLYASLSPRVVMVVTDEAIGSGALIGDPSSILTNWHVVKDYETVGVIYKPSEEGKDLTRADLRKARVVRFDEVADLALLKVEEPPASRKTIELGNLDEIPVGSDVHAIGHPTGESWTYTKGFVSQMRKEYEWVTDSGKIHRADVIQTQTPINPGNSGGPLLSDKYKLVGVNSFKAEGEALNFAVSVDEVRSFLKRQENRYAESSVTAEECEIQSMGSEKTQSPKGIKYFLDIDCDGEIDAFRLEPEDLSEPISLSMDQSGNGLIDVVFIDNDRDGKIDMSVYDTTGDGKPDLLGYHRNGEVEPYTFEEYK